MLLKGAYCVGEHFVDPQCLLYSLNQGSCESAQMHVQAYLLFTSNVTNTNVTCAGSLSLV